MEAEPVGFLFFLTILNWVTIKIQTFTLNCLSFLKKSSIVRDEKQVKNSVSQDRGGLRLSGEEVEMVMGRIGMLCNQEVEQFKEGMGFDELSAMFEEKEPSLEEVREAFSVFDENRDGFIDAMELQRVVSKLGFSKGLDLERCEEMIKAYDENRDGLIDLNEFVKIMESSFC